MKTDYEVIAVAGWVETIDDDIADLCNCYAESMGQENLQKGKDDWDVAERIALLWNLFRGISNEDVEKVVDIVNMLESQGGLN